MHPPKPGKPMVRVKSMMLIEGKGIEGAPQRTYDHRPARMKGDEDPNLRHFSMIHNDEIEEYKRALAVNGGMEPGVFAPGDVRTNAQLSLTITPEELFQMLGQELVLNGDQKSPGAILLLTIQRDPCRAMEKICKGAMEIMKGGRQGVFGRIIKSGKIFEGSNVYRVEYVDSKDFLETKSSPSFLSKLIPKFLSSSPDPSSSPPSSTPPKLAGEEKKIPAKKKVSSAVAIEDD